LAGSYDVAMPSGHSLLAVELPRIGAIAFLYSLSRFNAWLHTLSLLFDDHQGNVAFLWLFTSFFTLTRLFRVTYSRNRTDWPKIL